MIRWLSHVPEAQFPTGLQTCLTAGVYQRTREPELRSVWREASYLWGVRGRSRPGFYWNSFLAWACSRAALPGIVRIAERLEMVVGLDGGELVGYRRRTQRLLWTFETAVEMRERWRVALTDFAVVSETLGFVCLDLGAEHVWFPKVDASVLKQWVSAAE